MPETDSAAFGSTAESERGELPSLSRPISARPRRARAVSGEPCVLYSTIFVRFDVAYGAPAPREGVQPEEGGTLLGWGYIRMLP